MAHDPIATRYAETFFEAAKAERQVAEIHRQLTRIGWLCRDHPDLDRLLRNPGVVPDEKVTVLERSLKDSWSELLRAFVRMVISLGRAEALPDIAEAFQAAVDKDEGRLRVVVRSAHPLPEVVLHRLRTRLQRREQKQIELEAEVEPELLGGIQVRLDYRVIDGSVQRQLVELRERLTTVQVQ